MKKNKIRVIARLDIKGQNVIKSIRFDGLRTIGSPSEIAEKYYKNGIDEKMSIDNCTHSLFGVSKSYSDLIVQEYGKNLKLNTVVFRCGCITGENHAGVEAHGFLNYLVKQAIIGKKYKVINMIFAE